MAAAGVGALGGALLTAGLGRFGRRGPLLLSSTVAFGLALIAFAYSHWLPLSLAVLVLVGGGTTLYLGATNALLQTNIPDDVRGRIMSVYSLILGGFVPLGGMLLGSAASLTGSAPLVVAAGGGLVALSGLVILALVPALRAAG